MQIELNSTPAQPLLLNTIAPSAHSGTRGQTGQGCLCQRAPPLLEDPQVAGGAGARKATLLQATGPSGGAGWSQGPSWGRPHGTLPLGSPVCSCKAFPWGAYGPNSTGRPQTPFRVTQGQEGCSRPGWEVQTGWAGLRARWHTGWEAGRPRQVAVAIKAPAEPSSPPGPPSPPASRGGPHPRCERGAGT